MKRCKFKITKVIDQQNAEANSLNRAIVVHDETKEFPLAEGLNGIAWFLPNVGQWQIAAMECP